MSIASLVASLPGHLRERVRKTVERDVNPDGKYVLYWMSTALRVAENPALDTAKLLALATDRPLLVYQGLSHAYPYASDRHHTFILQGAREVQSQLQAHGIRYVLHVEKNSADRKVLIELANNATVILTEDMPTDPPRRFREVIQRKSVAPLLAVDTACVLPMQSLKRSFDRAFAFRDATWSEYQKRLSNSWQKTVELPRSYEGEVPFESIDLSRRNISEIVGQCDIDHGIGPVVDTVGGEEVGYQRWSRFKEQGLKTYAKRRNNALIDGVSRMSAYLHYGMVSPFRIAREAAQVRGEGGEKFLDELLIWRELAFNFCYHNLNHDSWDVLPRWARETLLAHKTDPREKTYSWEELARGMTDDELWNGAQLSLLRNGELHNNVRMTWGKRILDWLDDPRRALEIIIDLNHRYALDGRDPASYGGILWCLGLFDRPFFPEHKVTGSVRGRSTYEHAKRLDPKAYMQKVIAPRGDFPRVAVIGAGMSGLFAARTLADHGVPVTIFDKSRGTGGRMSTRRDDSALVFDHGAQYFTVRHPVFRRYVDSWIEQGVCAQWDGNVAVFRDGVHEGNSDVERFVGAPAMTAIGKHLAKSLSIKLGVHIESIEKDQQGWRLRSKAGELYEYFDKVVFALPAPQSAMILPNTNPLCERLRAIEFDPCWAMMLELDERLEVDWIGAFVNSGPIRWVARNNTKPGRDPRRETLVVHANPGWSRERFEMSSDEVMDELLDTLWSSLHLEQQKVVSRQAHRWRYSIPANNACTGPVFSSSEGIYACGDWSGGSRVEGAFISGMQVAGELLRAIGIAKPSQPVRQLSLFD